LVIAFLGTILVDLYSRWPWEAL